MIEQRLPDLGEGIEAGDVVRILVAAGDTIKAGQVIMELETNKATVELPADVAGVVKAIHVKEGQKIPVGTVVLSLEPLHKTSHAASAPKAEKKSVAAGAVVEQHLPHLGEGVEAGDVVKIVVAVGDTVKAGQVIMELETNKATVELPADVAGVVKAIHVKEGQKVSVGAAVISLAATGAVASAEPVKTKEHPVVKDKESSAVSSAKVSPRVGQLADRKNTIPAAPSLRRRARVLGLDLYNVPGTGPGGRITTEDFDRFLLSQGASKGAGIQAPPLPDFTKWGEVRLEPYQSLRKKTAEHVTMSARLIPHVTQGDEADVTALEAWRKAKGDAVQAKGGKLTPIVFLLKAVADALQKHPAFAASLDETAGQIIYKKYSHIGVAVDTPKGLMVPVIRDVAKKSMTDLALELSALGARAKEGKIKVDELQGGVFTISSLGHIGGTYFTPIINYPEVAILGVSRMAEKAVVREGKIVPRLMLPYALSYDHRVIDGVLGVTFTRAIAEFLENEKNWSL